MNRKILFRGKLKHRNEWVEGFLTKTSHDSEDMYIGFICSPIPVDPATVGQYTGLLDRNGKRIFEGDIVDELIPPNGLRMRFKVVWEHDRYWLLSKKGVYSSTTSSIEQTKNMEVIGNIHDNPELLEAKQ